MARLNKKRNIRPSILDRLIDNDPDNRLETDPDQHQKMKELRQSVRRDLENLLNTRMRIVVPDEKYSHLNDSLLNYGLPDLATVNISNIDKRREFVQQLERLLVDFEPRFKSVSVSYQENTDKAERTLKFRIDATLYADPSPEVIVFDSILEPVSRAVNVEEAGRV